MKIKENCTIVEQKEIAPDIFSMWIQTGKIAETAAAGQFVSLYSRDKSRMLPRPISLCEIDRTQGRLRLVYRIAGEGTREFSQMKEGEVISVLGPLGNGFPLDEARGKHVMLMGGGIGIPPMVQTARELNAAGTVAVAGYRDVLFLQEELKGFCDVYTATEDGSAGTKGTVLDAVREQALAADIIFACGPTPMLRAIKQYAAKQNIPCWISMEEKMACGVGACLACVCQSKEVDGHSHVHNKRICKDGPVFLASEVEL
ncbi:dihydroorotate dehydrogenase electron transfer subunit [Ruminococcus gauvreauii]|uniref:Dihydroorotate dehydrogenase B (NAD(+)), electron transfer subunit n=1 Tax=Ruminococcus gauvreauii TaxID=438033 RepID=A0ABY5VEC4_9FIRM|nr:dihydroorotate dehydrogenase electron transfer subunit [Ruminococcus gauvreauii]UWP58712.1 dihydroorotate dehydrogenase electron transfer subunit [Ruminococcus gauvreauii]